MTPHCKACQCPTLYCTSWPQLLPHCTQYSQSAPRFITLLGAACPRDHPNLLCMSSTNLILHITAPRDRQGQPHRLFPRFWVQQRPGALQKYQRLLQQGAAQGVCTSICTHIQTHTHTHLSACAIQGLCLLSSWTQDTSLIELARVH